MSDPEQFTYLYGNEDSVESKHNLSECHSHIMRDSTTGKYLYFGSIEQLYLYFNKQEKPYLHSVLNKNRPVRFNLELDISEDLLNNITIPKTVTDRLVQSIDINTIKYLFIIEHIKKHSNDILEEYWGVEISDYEYMEAQDNRKGKFSHRLYMKLAFNTLAEYKYFTRLLKAAVKPEVSVMIDPTTLNLRTPGSWKDNHQCKWIVNQNVSPTIEDSILSYTDNCDIIDVMDEFLADINPKPTQYDDPDDDMIMKANGIISSHPSIMGNFVYIGVKHGCLVYKRIQPSHCIICNREHDSIDAYATINNGIVALRCFRDEKKQSEFVGQIDVDEVELMAKFIGRSELMSGFSWSNASQLIKKQNRLQEIGHSQKEMQAMTQENETVFVQLKEKAAETQAELKDHKYHYSQFNLIHKKTFLNLDEINRYIAETVAKIVKGGNSLFITTDHWNNTSHFTELSELPCSRKTEAYEFNIVNDNFDPSQPIGKHNSMVNNMRLSDAINDYTMRNFYKTVDFIPYLIEPEVDRETFNLFEGFRFPYTEMKEQPDSIKPWIDHIRDVVCCGNVEHAKALTQWMAHIIQRPTEKAFAVIIYGKQGTGKSILYEFFKRCIGKDYALQVGRLDELTQAHNTHIRGKLIVNANEATNMPTIRDVNILKGLITETDLIINPKGVNQYIVSNFSRLLITSNHKDCMRLDGDDRRYFCLNISDSQKNNNAYFDPLVATLKDDKIQQDFFNYLSNYDISDFRPQRPPMSQMKRELIAIGVSNVVDFMHAVCENQVFDYDEDAVEINPTQVDLYAQYINWYNQNDARGRRENISQFISKLETEFGIQVNRPRIDGRRIRRFKINRAELLIKFKSHYHNDAFEYVVE